MSIKDAWAGSAPLRALLSFMAIVGAAAVVGMVTLIAEVRTNSRLLVEFKAEIKADIGEIRDDYGERLRFLERARRGLPAGSE